MATAATQSAAASLLAAAAASSVAPTPVSATLDGKYPTPAPSAAGLSLAAGTPFGAVLGASSAPAAPASVAPVAGSNTFSGRRAVGHRPGPSLAQLLASGRLPPGHPLFAAALRSQSSAATAPLTGQASQGVPGCTNPSQQSQQTSAAQAASLAASAAAFTGGPASSTALPSFATTFGPQYAQQFQAGLQPTYLQGSTTSSAKRGWPGSSAAGSSAGVSFADEDDGPDDGETASQFGEDDGPNDIEKAVLDGIAEVIGRLAALDAKVVALDARVVALDARVGALGEWLFRTAQGASTSKPSATTTQML